MAFWKVGSIDWAWLKCISNKKYGMLPPNCQRNKLIPRSSPKVSSFSGVQSPSHSHPEITVLCQEAGPGTFLRCPHHPAWRTFLWTVFLCPLRYVVLFEVLWGQRPRPQSLCSLAFSTAQAWSLSKDQNLLYGHTSPPPEILLNYQL